MAPVLQICHTSNNNQPANITLKLSEDIVSYQDIAHGYFMSSSYTRNYKFTEMVIFSSQAENFRSTIRPHLLNNE